MTNIVMLCHNRLRLTEQALKSLRDHTDPAIYSLTLVDDASDDFRVIRLLEDQGMAGTRTTLLRICSHDHVVARAKNIGVAWSEQTFGRGDWLYLSDSDVWFAPRWLETMTLEAAACGRSSMLNRFQLWGGQIHPFHGIRKVALPEPLGIMQESLVLDGPSWLMRWGTWDFVGPFRGNAPGACQSEDAEWCERLRTTGARIGVIHPHVVVHTGLTQSDGKPAPGADARRAMIPQGVFAE